MTGDIHITGREFDGFAKGIRDDVDQLRSDFSQGMAALTSRVDVLLLKSSEEARSMGELNAAIKAIGERLERMEKETSSHQTQIDELWEAHQRSTENRLSWWGQLAMLVLAALAGGWLTKRVL